ncbi:MAG TPA: LacI family DNA-binding transcriptional regulator [Anaerolineae bacterium]|nr:LacI family DNA-binding transcriptional regulator [Anaerolineae bacterium]
MVVSIKEIARRAGVSHSTVSRALHQSPLVRPDTAVRIRTLAEEMGYVPSAIGRGLATRSTHTLGLFVTTIADPFVSEVVRGAEELAMDHGYSVFLCQSGAQPQRELAAVRALHENRVVGVIVTSSRVGDLYGPLLAQMKVPIVLINNERSDPGIWFVSIDDRHGGMLATEHLLRIGRRRIGFIAGWPEATSSIGRLRGCVEALDRHALGASPYWTASANGRMDGGYAAAADMLSCRPLPDGLFCYNDLTAIGALKALREHGLRVPDDIAVVGFDDIAMAAFTCPPLTTVAQPRLDMGRLAVCMLLDLIAGRSVESQTLEGSLVIRESTLAAQGGDQ